MLLLLIFFYYYFFPFFLSLLCCSLGTRDGYDEPGQKTFQVWSDLRCFISQVGSSISSVNIQPGDPALIWKIVFD